MGGGVSSRPQTVEWSHGHLPTPMWSLRWLPLLAERADAILGSDEYTNPRTKNTVHTNKKSPEIVIWYAYQFLSTFLPATSERQGLDYEMNARLHPESAWVMGVRMLKGVRAGAPIGQRSGYQVSVQYGSERVKDSSRHETRCRGRWRRA